MEIDAKAAGTSPAPLVAGILTYFIALWFARRGVDLPTDVQLAMATLLAMVLTFVTSTLIPITEASIRRRLTNKIVKEADADPKSLVDLSLAIDDKIVRKAQLNPNSDVSYVIPPVPVPAGEAPTILPVAAQRP